MYFAKIETDRASKMAHDKAHKAAARERREGMKHLRREECAPNRKKMAKLQARIKDWDASVSTMKGSTEGFHKPGSFQ